MRHCGQVVIEYDKIQCKNSDNGAGVWGVQQTRDSLIHWYHLIVVLELGKSGCSGQTQVKRVQIPLKFQPKLPNLQFRFSNLFVNVCDKHSISDKHSINQNVCDKHSISSVPGIFVIQFRPIFWESHMLLTKHLQTLLGHKRSPSTVFCDLTLVLVPPQGASPLILVL